jgi:uncharacterized cupredoxin-like copper-binding protein
MRFNLAVVGCSVCLLLLWGLTGCGGGGGGGEETTTGGQASTSTTTSATTASTEGKMAAESPIATIQVNETEMSLDPSEITLDRPGTYVFRAVNTGNVVHALRIEGNGIEEQSTRDIGPGESADLQVNLKPGSYEIDCPVDNHEDQGMRGTVTVRES